MTKRKICALGDFAVGKTSLANRIFHNNFSEDYRANIGVRIYSKEVRLAGRIVNVEWWDLPAEDENRRLEMSHLRGASACVLVVDKTRSYTLNTAFNLQQRIQNHFPKLPIILVVNKSDLTDDSEIDEARLTQIEQQGWNVIQTSARLGDKVNIAFIQAISRH